MTDDLIPRCSHGRIILGCPHDDCPEQSAYLAQQSAALDRWYDREKREARAVVRDVLGLPPVPFDSPLTEAAK